MIKQFLQRLQPTKNKTIINTLKTTVMKQGTVKFFNTAKGFGFITVNDSNEEVFVHSTNLIDEIQEDDHVQFDVERGQKGLSAVKVSLV
tara:strand:+ start:624 stop:890 length:267 start_codon:yes stop_codon:yes gene_type:complete